jgi:hypothetical protein
MPPNRHVEFKKGGWGAAIITVIATVAVFSPRGPSTSAPSASPPT